MAQELPKYKLAESSWSGMKAQCPVCNNTFSSWYCPNCGLPKNNNAYYEYEGETFYCGPNHFRREFEIDWEYQLCSKCFAPNPYNAKYCRNCREEIYLHAEDKNGHGWIDLGLSVLWSTVTMDGFYRWNNSELIYDEWSWSYYRKTIDGKDAATMRWGEKWRIPTKDEFEELLNKCKWEKCILPNGMHALKVTGPNGNSIFLRTIGTPIMGDFSNVRNEDCDIRLWTSSKGFRKGSSCPEGYAFVFTDMELYISPGCALRSQEERRRFLMSQEERRRLWLENPIKWRDEKDICSNVRLIGGLGSIRPVADKKWQGCL